MCFSKLHGCLCRYVGLLRKSFFRQAHPLLEVLLFAIAHQTKASHYSFTLPPFQIRYKSASNPYQSRCKSHP